MATKRETGSISYVTLATVAIPALLLLGGLAWYGHSFAANMVHNQLAEQKIYFPEAGSQGFDAAEYPTLQKYAGKQVIDGPTAKAYAEDYIGHHLDKMAGGKTYAEVSALSMKDPKDATLQQQKAALFQGETLKGMLLVGGYAFWCIGEVAKWAALALFGIAAALAGSLAFLRRK